MHVSIHKDQFERSDLIALACRLARDFSEEDELFAQIYDDFDSAKRWLGPWEQEKPAGWEKYDRSFRAGYLRDVQKREHWIIWDTNPEKTQQERIEICLPPRN